MGFAAQFNQFNYGGNLGAFTQQPPLPPPPPPPPPQQPPTQFVGNYGQFNNIYNMQVSKACMAANFEILAYLIINAVEEFLLNCSVRDVWLSIESK